jgi:ferredoxin
MANAATAKAKSKPNKAPKKRKKKPRMLAYITENCTGCAGAPVCQSYCPVEECMLLVQNPSAPVFGVIEVDPFKCIGCQKCITKGPEGTLLDGCPWDAIVMEPIKEYEAKYGELPY